MHTENLNQWSHSHSFGQEKVRKGERKTLIVIAITATMMIAEIVAGISFGSMALLADGLHMASHTVALGITALAYVYARRRAHDERFAFGTGKVNALAGYTGAVLLAGFAVLMAWESVDRFLNPVTIVFNQAILVAILGLFVNAASVFILGVHDHAHHDHDDGHHHHDHNLRSAYLHVLADALTSFTAIFALLAGKYLGLHWMDPLMGIVGSLLVTRWSWGLLRDTTQVLLDHQAPEPLRSNIRRAIEDDSEDRIADLHVWSIGSGLHAAAISIVSHDPNPPEYYKGLMPDDAKLAHATIEVHRCPG